MRETNNTMKQMLSLKQNKFTSKYLETGNATEATMQVYKPKNRATARAIGSENLTKPNIRQSIHEALEAQGLTNEHLAGKIAKLVNAQKKITVLRSGETEAVIEEVDTQAVKAGLEFAFKIKMGEIEHENQETILRWKESDPEEIAMKQLLVESIKKIAERR